jgi:hypothetical protein
VASDNVAVLGIFTGSPDVSGLLSPLNDLDGNFELKYCNFYKRE